VGCLNVEVSEIRFGLAVSLVVTGDFNGELATDARGAEDAGEPCEQQGYGPDVGGFLALFSRMSPSMSSSR
jgi:hypothetical protein